jgi:16S rRNA (guanine1207-N2)-methyltransferase
MSHYYSEKQDDIESNPSEFIYKFNDHSFKFHTDNGVFSKEYVDYGSYAMLKEFKPNNIDLPILDMGSGYGPIGIIVSKLHNKEVHMCEINERAYNLSLKNIKENDANCIAYHSNLYEKLPDNLIFSSIITNPPIRAGKDVIFSIYEGAYTHLAIGGELWVVIQKKQGAPSTKAKLEEIFNNCEIMKRDKGYYILKSIKKDMK